MNIEPPSERLQPPPPRRRSSSLPWILAGFGLMALLGMGMLMGLATIAGGAGGLRALGDEGESVGLVELRGPIDDPNARNALDQLWRMADNDEVKAMVLRIDSPGGQVGPSEELYREIRRIREAGKPVVASMASVAASGGFYAALGCDRIFANAGTLTGSIGVIVMTTHGPELLDEARLDVATYKSGALKDAGSFSRSPTSSDRAFFQETVREVFGQFVESVKEARGLDDAALEPVLDGRVVSGRQALKLGLIDEIGGLAAAGRKALELAGHPPDTRARFLRPREDVPPWVRAVFDSMAHSLAGAVREVAAPARTGGALVEYRAPLHLAQ